MGNLNMRIIDVENGYVVIEDDPSRHMEVQRKWIAVDPTDLGELVTELAKEWRKNNPKKVKVPDAHV